MAAALLAVLVLLSCTVFAQEAPQDKAPAKRIFEKGSDALILGQYEEAIAQFELYADGQPIHPDASYNRGLAYLARVRAGAERAGDLGRASAAFEEALLMRPGDQDTAHARALVHGEVARRRSRRGKDVLIARPSLDREVMNLLSERSWAILAILASFFASLGWLLRLLRKRGAWQLAGVILVPLGLIAAVVLTPTYFGARTLRLERRPGVLVVPEAHLTDRDGVAQSGDPLPEGAFLELGDRQGRLLHVRYGSVEGWIPSSTVRTLRFR
jgi:tetratricopeptide (TPR) repeat protein